MMSEDWKEKDFETWFGTGRPLLGHDLLTVRIHSTGTNEPDLIALDENGTLVVIEVKSSSAVVGREEIGQCVEYLSLCMRTSIINDNVRREFLERFNVALPAEPLALRLMIIAGEFEWAALASCEALSGALNGRLEMASAVKAVKVGDYFQCHDAQSECPRVWLSELAILECGRGRDNFIHVLLQKDPVVSWCIGKDDGSSSRLQANTMKGSIRTKDIRVEQIDKPKFLSLEQCGVHVQRSTGTVKFIDKILGCVDGKKRRIRFLPGAPPQLHDIGTGVGVTRPYSGSLPNWYECARLAADKWPRSE
jgi:hypothetical protein